MSNTTEVRWADELDDMRQLMVDAAAAITVDETLVDAETRETVRVFVDARREMERASELVKCGRLQQTTGGRHASALVMTGRYGGMGHQK